MDHIENFLSTCDIQKGRHRMTHESLLQHQAEKRHSIETAITQLFAPEDEGLKNALRAGRETGLPEIQISPIQGKLLQLLATANQARKILEIGSLAGYSGIWLARALPADGHLISIEINPHHADVIRTSFSQAGVSDRTEVRVGKALDVLPQLATEAPFDLIFIDADKAPYPHYLEWALKFSRSGTIIVADNCIRGGSALQIADTNTLDPDTAGLVQYNQLVRNNPRLTSLALAIDEDNTDGFTISVVKSE
jgi:caffeoyl-CoA O-methyltransferase